MTSRIKILFIIHSLGGGGAERVMVNLLRHLDRSKLEPLLAVVNLKSVRDYPKFFLRLN